MPASSAKVDYIRIEMFLKRATPVGFRFLFIIILRQSIAKYILIYF